MRVVRRFQNEGQSRRDHHGARNPRRAMPRNITHNFAATHGMTDQSDVAEIEFLDHLAQVVSERVVVVPAAWVAGAPEPALVVGYTAKAAAAKVNHLVLP